MKRERRHLRTESYPRASDRSEDRGEISILSIKLTRAVSSEVTIFSIQRFIPSQQFYPLLVKSPENLSAQQKLTKNNKLA